VSDRFAQLTSDYFDDVVIAMNDDAVEVMFTRGLAHCSKSGTGGFIPTTKLPSLTRKPAQALKIARKLTTAIGEFEGPWVQVEHGFQIRNWHIYMAKLEQIEQRKKADRERQARHRSKEKSRDLSRDTSHQMSRDVTTPEIEKEQEAAAAAPKAAARGGKIPVDNLPGPVLKLRDRFAELTVLNTVRFTDLTPEWLEKLLPLIDRHGVDTLTDFARRTQRPVGGVSTVQGFVPTWADIAAPRAVSDEPRCPCGLTVAACDRKNSKLDDENRCHERATA
jgi:hypothetical protein